MVKYGILGTGDVGKAFSKGVIALGHEAVLGTRDASGPKAEELRQAGFVVKTFDDAAAWADQIVFAFGWTVQEDVLKLLKPEHLAGKVVLDAVNPLVGGWPPQLEFVFGSDKEKGSAAEYFQKRLPEAKIVKAFCHIGNAFMFDVSKKFEPGQTPSFWLAGNDAEAKAAVVSLVKSTGWESVIDAGDLTAARWIEAFVIPWCLTAAQHGFKGGFRWVLPKAN